MRLRTFTAPDMSKAMLLIRETLGDEAVIISTARDASGRSVSVTAALEDVLDEEEALQEILETEPTPDLEDEEESVVLQSSAEKVLSKPPLMSRDAIFQNRSLAYHLHEIEKTLQFHGTPAGLIDKILRVARHLELTAPNTPEGIEAALTEVLSHIYNFAPLTLESTPDRIMLVGAPGVGKTTAIAKLAAHLVADKLPIQVITIDNKKAGSVEQLRAFTSIMGVRSEVAGSRTELRQALKATSESRPVVIDSFGVNPYAYAELKELAEFANVRPIEPLLVMAAGTDATEAADIARAFSFMGTKRMLVSKVDASRRLGAMLTAAEAADLALCSFTHSSQVAGGLQELNAVQLSQMLLAYRHDQG